MPDTFEDRRNEDWLGFVEFFSMGFTIRDIWELGFERGYFSGLDRGMEIEHEVQAELKLEDMEP